MDYFSALYKENIVDNQSDIRKGHVHSSHQVIFICEGEIDFAISGKIYLASKDVICFASGIETHSIKVLAYPYKRYLLDIPESFLKKLHLSRELTSILNVRPKDFNHIVNVDGIKDELLFYFKKLVVESELYKVDTIYSFESISSIFVLFLTEIFRYKPRAFPYQEKEIAKIIYEVKDYVDNNYNEDTTISKLSESFYISQSSLNQGFKLLTGYSPKRYIMLSRIAKARKLLYSTDMQISEISREVGFNDINNFIRYFKGETGQTPFQFRKSLRALASSKN